jgi:hypothetical protein
MKEHVILSAVGATVALLLFSIEARHADADVPRAAPATLPRITPTPVVDGAPYMCSVSHAWAGGTGGRSPSDELFSFVCRVAITPDRMVTIASTAHPGGMQGVLNVAFASGAPLIAVFSVPAGGCADNGVLPQLKDCALQSVAMAAPTVH